MNKLPTALEATFWQDKLAHSMQSKIENSPAMRLAQMTEKFNRFNDRHLPPPAFMRMERFIQKLNPSPQLFLPQIPNSLTTGYDEYEPAEIKPLLIMPEAKTVVNHYIPLEPQQESLINIDSKKHHQSITPLSDRGYKLIIWVFNLFMQLVITLLAAYFVYQWKWN